MQFRFTARRVLRNVLPTTTRTTQGIDKVVLEEASPIFADIEIWAYFMVGQSSKNSALFGLTDRQVPVDRVPVGISNLTDLSSTTAKTAINREEGKRNVQDLLSSVAHGFSQ